LLDAICKGLQAMKLLNRILQFLNEDAG